MTSDDIDHELALLLAREGSSFDEMLAAAKETIHGATCQTFGAYNVTEMAGWLISDHGWHSTIAALVISTLVRDGYFFEPKYHQEDANPPPWPVYRPGD